MANRFFIWKDTNCNGTNPEWIELSGDEFFKFITKPENSHRRFIKEYIDEDNIELGYYKFEVNEENFRKWETSRKQKQRSEDVLIANRKKFRLSENDDVDEKQIRSIPTVVSFDAPVSDEDDATYHDIIPDTENGFEVIERKQLLEVIFKISREFPKEERDLLDKLYFNNPENLSDNEIARLMKMPTTTFNRKKLKILKKLSEKVG